LYVYTSHDEDTTVRNFFTMNDWRCYSTDDMVNWTDHGSILSYKDFEWSRGDAWAGQCIYRNGKFYYYVPVNEKKGGNAIGVAVADNPTGPFKDALGKPLLRDSATSTPPYSSMMTTSLFILGQSQSVVRQVEQRHVVVRPNPGWVQEPLTKEGFYIRHKDTIKRPSSYEEGPWLYKRQDTYYLLYPAAVFPSTWRIPRPKAPPAPGPMATPSCTSSARAARLTNHPA
jgi:beta-xylosidase